MRVDDHGQIWRFGYVALAALSGAFTALGFVKWRELSGAEIAMTLIGGFSFAIFVTPWIAHEWIGVAESNTRAIAALTYVFGSGSNILLPTIIRTVKRIFPTGDGA
jgi:hypothetical protein